MKFAEHKDPSLNIVRKITPDAIWVNDQALSESFFMTQHHLHPQWDITSIEALNTKHLDTLLALRPTLIILGTGSQQIFPSAELSAYVLQKGVGLEIMHNDAACRTWNVLTTEERAVVLAIIQPKTAV